MLDGTGCGLRGLASMRAHLVVLPAACAYGPARRSFAAMLCARAWLEVDHKCCRSQGPRVFGSLASIQ
eukprot:7097938-Alexandrium_andersonii.AAC.1